ncbi:unnamed protein product [Penicillium nalgiovense]|nr:unnamed protein product [Penicillium nalgiovense]
MRIHETVQSIDNLSAMADPDVQSMRDCVVLSIINAFGLFYFYLFTIHFLLFHFPSSPAEILVAMSVLVFCAGVIVWYFLSLVYRILHTFQGNDSGNLQKLEFGGALILIWTATIPSAVLLLRNQPSLQLGYLSAFTIVAVGTLVDFLVWGSSIHASRSIFPYACPPSLAIHFGRVAMWNSLGAAFYLLRPLERVGAVNDWRPSLYVMHIVLAYSAVSYSRVILHTVLGYAA